MVDIEQADGGVEFDLSPCASSINSIVVAFNNYAITHGITHLTPLMQLLSSLSLKLSLFREGFDGLFRISKVHEMWQYMECLSELSNKFNDTHARFNVIVLLCYHFFAFDKCAISEVPKLIPQIKSQFESTINLAADTVFSWYKGVQDPLLEAFLLPDVDTNKEARRKMLLSDRLL
jgi:hypothetical protein